MAIVTENACSSADLPPVTVDRWAAISGRWKFEGQSAVYEGPADIQSGPPFGIALGSIRFRDGCIVSRARLTRNERTSAGVLFGYQSLESPYFVASIGGFDKAYSICEYRPGHGWFSIADAGTIKNLAAEHDYTIELKVSGQVARMTVDDVDVLDIVLSRPMEGTAVGLYAWGDAKVAFAETTIGRNAPTVFVIMPFEEPFDTLYREVILPNAESLGFEVIRIDEIRGPGLILEDIQQQIAQAQAVVAEITTHNPNVFYELGYAHALKKPAVLLVRREEGAKMPFDVQGYRAIFYDDTIGGKKIVERNLRQHLDAIRRDG